MFLHGAVLACLLLLLPIVISAGPSGSSPWSQRIVPRALRSQQLFAAGTECKAIGDDEIERLVSEARASLDSEKTARARIAEGKIWDTHSRVGTCTEKKAVALRRSAS